MAVELLLALFECADDLVLASFVSAFESSLFEKHSQLVSIK
jgi:hypothetical protein